MEMNLINTHHIPLYFAAYLHLSKEKKTYVRQFLKQSFAYYISFVHDEKTFSEKLADVASTHSS